MTAKTRIAVAAHPDLNLRVKFNPLDFEVAFEGTVAVSTGDIHLHFDEIPMSSAIPFLHRRVVASSIGPFGVHVKPFEAQVRAVDFNTRGTIGRNDAELALHATGNCKAEIDVSGGLPDKLLKAAVKTIIEE